MAKVLKHFYIRTDQAKKLAQLAEQTGKFQAEIIREALDNHFKSKGGTL